MYATTSNFLCSFLGSSPSAMDLLSPAASCNSSGQPQHQLQLVQLRSWPTSKYTAQALGHNSVNPRSGLDSMAAGSAVNVSVQCKSDFHPGPGQYSTLCLCNSATILPPKILLHLTQAHLEFM